MAQRLLYENFANKLFAICRRYLSNEHEAKDVLQDCFIKIFSHIHQFNGKGSFEGWMFKIAVNTALKHLRKNKGKKYFLEIDNTELYYDDHDIESVFSENEGFNDVNFQSIDQSDFSKEEIHEIIMSIPEHYRIIFSLFHLENYSHDEIANLLSIDARNSRIRLLRARNLIKNAFAKKIEEIKNLKK